VAVADDEQREVSLHSLTLNLVADRFSRADQDIQSCLHGGSFSA